MRINKKIAVSVVRQLFLLGLAAAAAMAQTAGSGSINGTVTDPSGSSIPGAAVVVHNADTGADRSLQSNDSGIYSAPFLQPGHYDITVGKPGFTKTERKGITLEVGRNLTIDFKLTVQSGTESVTVTSEAPVVDTEKTQVSQEVSATMVQNLPLVGRRWESFVLLTPGVTSDGALVSFRGISGLYNNNSVDGANNNQSFFSEARGRSAATTGVPYIYSLDAIKEFQVNASNYSAEFGQAAGGVVNAVTKSGGNSIHGDLFYYLRYPSFNALDSFAKSQGIKVKTVRQQQQFGGSVGGALIKDKLFYFLNYDGARRVFPITYTSTSVPASGFALTCPTQLTATQCNSARNFITGQIGPIARTGVNDIAFGKIDYQASNNHRFSLAFDLDNYHAPNSYRSLSTYNNEGPTANGPIVLHERFLVGNWDWTPRSNLVNNFRFQWGMDNEITGANFGGPAVIMTNVINYGMPNALPRPGFPNERRWQFADTASANIGKHTIKFGVDVNEIHEKAINLFQGGGQYNYTTGAAQQVFTNWALDTYGVNIGDGLTGKHYTSFVQVTDPITGIGKDDWWENDFGGFIEDSWKVKKNLTLNLGLRYEIQLTPQPPRPNTLNPLNEAWTSRINQDTNNFAPRLGLAWNPLKDTVVRMGWGMFYGKTSNSTYYAYRVENGIYQQTFNCNTATCPNLTFPNLLFTPPGPAPAAPFAGALSPQVTPQPLSLSTQLVRGMTKDFVNPLIHEGDVTLERQIKGMSVSAGWLFSRGLRLPVFVDANLGPATGTHTYAVLTGAAATSPVATTFSTPWYPAGTRIDNRTGDILTGYSVVNSWYHGLVLTMKRPMTHGFEFLANYTFAKSIDDGAVNGANGTFNGTDWPLDPHNQKAENSLSDLDQRHRFTGSAIYFPQMFKKMQNKAAKAIVDGWGFSLVATAFTGQPVSSVFLVNGFPGGGVNSGLTGGAVTNTGGTTGGRPGHIGRNVYKGPGLTDYDLRVTRDFGIKEKLHLQILAEAFNIFNHTNITKVNTTAFNYTAACTAAPNGCLTPSPTFLAPTSTTADNGLYGSRQMQFSAKIIF